MLGEKSGIPSLSTNEMELLDFRIYELRDDNRVYEGVYGINVAKVEGVVVFPDHIFDLPAAPDYVIGTFDLRGEIVPLVDLTKWIRVQADPSRDKDRKVIIAIFNNIKIGFAIHEAKRIRRISWKDIDGAEFGMGGDDSRSKITGTTRIEDGITLLILDVEGIIDDLDFYDPMKTLNKDDGSMREIPKFDGMALVLDDSVIARKLLRTSLANAGFDLVEAVNGEDGLQKLEMLYAKYGSELNKHLKIIVSDVEMPKMDGFHFAELVKQDSRFSNIPVVFNSSICDKISEEKGKKVGADAYLVKFDAGSFYDEISKILSK